MERTIRLQIPIDRETAKALKMIAAGRSTSIAEMVREAIETQYGADVRAIQRVFVPPVSTGKANRK